MDEFQLLIREKSQAVEVEDKKSCVLASVSSGKSARKSPSSISSTVLSSGASSSVSTSAGGSGKTTLADLACHWLNFHSIMVVKTKTYLIAGS